MNTGDKTNIEKKGIIDVKIGASDTNDTTGKLKNNDELTKKKHKPDEEFLCNYCRKSLKSMQTHRVHEANCVFREGLEKQRIELEKQRKEYKLMQKTFMNNMESHKLEQKTFARGSEMRDKQILEHVKNNEMRINTVDDKTAQILKHCNSTGTFIQNIELRTKNIEAALGAVLGNKPAGVAHEAPIDNLRAPECVEIMLDRLLEHIDKQDKLAEKLSEQVEEQNVSVEKQMERQNEFIERQSQQMERQNEFIEQQSQQIKKQTGLVEKQCKQIEALNDSVSILMENSEKQNELAEKQCKQIEALNNSISILMENSKKQSNRNPDEQLEIILDRVKNNQTMQLENILDCVKINQMMISLRS